MGLDGGTKITRSDVLRGQSWRMSQSDGSRSTRGGCVTQTFQEKQLDAQTRRAILWSCCALSGLPLAAPVVADLLGQLYNRHAVLEYILAARGANLNDEAAQLRYSNQQRTANNMFDHLKAMKDVFTVQLTPNPDLQQQEQQQYRSGSTAVASAPGSTGSTDVPLWICPVTLLPAGGKQPFSALKPCGHVLSDKALAAVTAADKSCPVCGLAFGADDAVQINGSQEHMDAVRQKLQAKAAAKAAAKRKKVAEGALLLAASRKRKVEVIEQGNGAQQSGDLAKVLEANGQQQQGVTLLLEGMSAQATDQHAAQSNSAGNISRVQTERKKRQSSL